MDIRSSPRRRVSRFFRLSFSVYILASDRNGTLYIGSTDGLIRRVWQHKEEIRQSFTARYGVHSLVWYETHESRENAFRRERRIKKWNRAWKIRLIERFDPGWRDLYEELW
ncbi:MAG TPA: GIY-YIG nuclease family protein [Caulobacteraceae bacterium]|nr:GIY-YIG nuclease family protein [Caulobacteraceae bacterium]